ncbi:hypothetical protein [Virgisporangium aliadipatigenens]|nr:hypothetical protein [Virgisporangium aliadipatigenens]
MSTRLHRSVGAVGTAANASAVRAETVPSAADGSSSTSPSSGKADPGSEE